MRFFNFQFPKQDYSQGKSEYINKYETSINKRFA